MTQYVMRILGLCNGPPTAYDGQWLLEYDVTRPGVSPDGLPTLAHLLTTPDKSAALRFDGVEALHAAWSASAGLRPDGAPNRPLTAFNIEVQWADEDAAGFGPNVVPFRSRPEQPTNRGKWRGRRRGQRPGDE
jgi:hypothetical protein